LLAETINGWSAVGFWARMGWEACFTLFSRGSFSVFAVRVSITAQHPRQAILAGCFWSANWGDFDIELIEMEFIGSVAQFIPSGELIH